MPKIKATVTVNLRGLTRYREALESDLRLKANGPLRRALDEWGAIYARFLTKRWFVFSMGGGNWKKLKPATLERKKKAGLLPWILRATDQMFQAFAPSLARKPGRVSEQIPFGTRVGFGGGMQYPHSMANMPIARLAMIHQVGGGSLPARKIIVPPDAETRAEMREVMREAVLDLARGRDAA